MLKFTLEVDGPITSIWQARTDAGNIVEVRYDSLSGKYAYSLTSKIGYRLTGAYADTFDEAVAKATERAAFYSL